MSDRNGGHRISSRTVALAIAVALFVIVSGTAIAYWATTDGGDVTVERVTFETESGVDLAGTVYEPPDASAEDPAPAVLLIHGYTGERGTMSSFATELADRGYVAVAVDQPGHAESDPPAYADGWGGPAALTYTRNLEPVDENRVGMVGHSMGGFAALAAAEDQPEGYAAVVLVGSSWGNMTRVGAVPTANESFPRNMAVLFSPWDEFAPYMYGVDIPGNVHRSEKLADAFGTTPPIQRGRTYGSIENGTARQLESPRTIHTGMHRSTVTVDATLSWIERTLAPDVATNSSTSNTSATGGEGTASSGMSTDTGALAQQWYWATAGHVFAFLGALVVLVGVTTLVYRSVAPGTGGISSAGDWARRRTVVLSAIPALAFYPLYGLGTAVVPVTRLTHQELTHGYLLWALGSLALCLGYSRLRDDLPALSAYRPARGASERGVAAAVAGVVVTFALVTALFFVPGSGFRAWLVGLGPLTLVRAFSALVYGPPLFVAGLVLSYGLAGVHNGRSLHRGVGWAVVIAGGGLAVFIAIQYVPFLLGFGMPIPELAPLASVGLRTLFGLAVVTAVASAITGLNESPLPGGLVAGLLATWLLVMTSPIHVTPV